METNHHKRSGLLEELCTTRRPSTPVKFKFVQKNPE